MSLGARVYIVLLCLVGASGFAASLIEWPHSNLWLFLVYCLITVVGAALKVTLPGITGTMSVSYVFILASVVESSPGEAAIIGVIANLVQSFWKAKARPQLVQLAFNSSVAAISVLGTYAVYHHGLGIPGQILRLAASAGVYFVLNTGLVSGVLGLTEHKNVVTVWRTCYFWSFPYYLIGASLAALITYFTDHWNWELALAIVPVIYIVFRSYHVYLGKLENEKTHAEQMAALHLRTIEALALAIEAKDQTTGKHLRRVQVYAREIGKSLGLPNEQERALEAASILHDIGKLAVPDYIISKPGRLTPEEFEKMKIHPVVGAEILEAINFPYPVVPIVGAHHEKWDGTGYPYGLQGDNIPVGARILSCVDCFDALASDRQYRPALPLERALAEVQSESGKSFDPKVVEILSERYLELEKLVWEEPQGETKKLSTDLCVVRGASPDAGYESAQPPQIHDAARGFVSSIAAARQELQSLYELTQTIGSSLSVSETLSVVAARIQTLVPYNAIVVYLDEGRVLVPYYVTGENYGLFSSLRIPLGQGLSGWVAENHKPILNGNPSVEPGHLDDPSKFSTLRSAIAVPLEGINGCIGVLALYAASKNAFSKDHLRILLAIGGKVSMAIENALSYQRARQEATTDALTSLPNASSLFLRLESAISEVRPSGSELSVLVFDLDGFKQVNDEHGHLAGNRVLQEVARAMKSRCRDTDYIARMGGDEFVAILPGCTQQSVAGRARDFETCLGDVPQNAGFAANLRVSVGTATFPADGDDPDTLLATADRKMYRAKREKRLNTPRQAGIVNLAESIQIESLGSAGLAAAENVKS